MTKKKELDVKYSKAECARKYAELAVEQVKTGQKVPSGMRASSACAVAAQLVQGL